MKLTVIASRSAFAIDQDGIVRVTAQDQGSGREQSIRVTASSGQVLATGQTPTSR